MLRPLKAPHLLPLLQGWKFTTVVTPAVALNIGSEEGSIARNAAGKVTITPIEPCSREGVVVCTPGADIAQGAYGCFDTAHAESSFKAELLNAAGTGDDGTGYALSVGFEADEDDRYPFGNYQSVRNSRLSPRLMGFKVLSDNSLSLGKAQASVAVASSVATLTFANAFQGDCVVVASPIAATRKAVRVTAATAKLASIEAYDPVGTALEDNSFYALVLGWDNPSIAGVSRRVVEVPQLKPRLEVFRVDGTGTAAIDFGSTDATLTDNGTGDYTLTWKEPFAREPIVIVTGKDNPAQLLAAATSTACQFGCFNKTTHAAVDDEVYVVVLGYDYDSEI